MSVSPVFSVPALILPCLQMQKNIIMADKTPTGWHGFTGIEAYQIIKYLTLALHQQGFKVGDKIALHLDNKSLWVLCDLAIMSLGAVCVPLYLSQPLSQVAQIVKHADVKLIFTQQQAMIHAYDPVYDVIYMPHAGITDNADFSLLLQMGKKLDIQYPDLFEEIFAQRNPDELASISYSSGTTGTPKGVMLSHLNFIHAIQSPLQKSFLNAIKDVSKHKVLSFLPLTHIFEHTVIYSYLLLKIPVYFLAKPDAIKHSLEEIHPAHFTAVPRVIEKIYDNIWQQIESHFFKRIFYKPLLLKFLQKTILNKPISWMQKILTYPIRKKFGKNLCGITVGGAALAPHLMDFFYGIGIAIAQGYGLTETTGAVSIYDRHYLKKNSVGKIIEGLEVKIADDGEIMVRGNSIMQGYYQDSAQTDAILKNGWFYTGDIGYLDSEGFLYITERKKAMFKLSTGKYIYPTFMEQFLEQFPLIAQALVYGEGNKRPLALCMIAESYHDWDTKKLHDAIASHIQYLNQKLAPWEQIETYYVSKQTFSMDNHMLTPTFKKKRDVILKNIELLL